MPKEISELGSAPTDPQLDTTTNSNKATINPQIMQGGATNNQKNASVQSKPQAFNTILNTSTLKKQLNNVINVSNKAAIKKRKRQTTSKRQTSPIAKIEYAPSETRKVALEAAKAIVNDSNPKHDKVFGYGSNLVSIQVEQPTTVRGLTQLNSTSINYPQIPVVKKYNRISMRHRLEQSAEYIPKDSYRGNIPRPWPNDIIDGIFSQTEVMFPVLTGIVPHPFVGSNGKLITKQGYDEATGLYLKYADQLSNKLIKKPTKNQVKKALKFLCDTVLEDFPFAEEIDKITTVAVFLTAIQRKMITDDSGCPGFLFDAPMQSTGKTALAQTISYSIFGGPVAASSWCDKDAEMAKLLLAILLEGHGCILFDNLAEGTCVESNELAKAMTGNSYSGRILGQNKTASVPSNTLWIFTGNNISISGDFNTRLIPIRLDSNLTDPDRRNYKRTDIGEWCLKHRADIIKACLTIIRADCSQLDKSIKPTRYPDWDKYVRLPLLAASGIDIADKFQLNKQADPKIEARAIFLAEMFNKYGRKAVTAKELISGFSPYIADIFGTDMPTAQQLGKWLGGFKGQVLNGYRITSSKGTSGDAKNRTIWAVEKINQK